MVEVFIALGIGVIWLIGYLAWKIEPIECPECKSTKVHIVGEWDGMEDWECDKCHHYWFKEYKVNKKK